MIISDLNYLEVVEDSADVTGGTGGLSFNKNLSSNVKTNNNFNSNTNIQDIFKKYADIKVESKVKGNSSSLAFANEAVGYNSNTQGAFSQLSIAGKGSSQEGLFVSAANY